MPIEFNPMNSSVMFPALKRMLADEGIYSGKVDVRDWDRQADMAFKAFCLRKHDAKYSSPPKYIIQPSYIKDQMRQAFFDEVARQEEQGTLIPIPPRKTGIDLSFYIPKIAAKKPQVQAQPMDAKTKEKTVQESIDSAVRSKTPKIKPKNKKLLKTRG